MVLVSFKPYINTGSTKINLRKKKNSPYATLLCQNKVNDLV